MDTDAIFKSGFLADVYNERPVGPGSISKVITRFPPEPNGFLHLGHTKAIMINFGFARFHGGECLLRFDDTNPSGEEEKYFVAIEEIVSWLGFKPAKITSSSNNFLRLYKLAEDLVSRGRAYVCHCTSKFTCILKLNVTERISHVDQRSKSRIKGVVARARNQDTHAHTVIVLSPNLSLSFELCAGEYKPQEAVLRMKQDLGSGNPQMWDIAAYRVLSSDRLHHKTGDTWKIYPTYDFTHCLCDSFEGVTHSLCSTEFELSRVSYEWLCDELGVYKPMQRECVFLLFFSGVCLGFA